MSTYYSTKMESTFSSDYNMKQFISATGMFIKNRTEESTSLITRHLQLISVSIDYSIFDPNTSVVCEFFVSLHELLNTLTSMDARSNLAWYCVNALATASKNAAARHQLIHTYQFIPALSRLLGDHLSQEKKIRLLTVMQELSCGMKITWQIPHLTHLLSTLTRWITNDNEDIVTLSVGMLANLCYKNLPAIYTLSRCVDIKKFVRLCSKLEGPKLEINVCRLIIILDNVHGLVTKQTFLGLLKNTFKSVIEAYQAKDPILLRQVVEFYLDVLKQVETNTSYIDYIAIEFENYHENVEGLLNAVNNNSSGDSNNHDPECIQLIFKFLHSLIELKLTKLASYYKIFIEVSLRWIQNETVSAEALNILKSVVLNGGLNNPDISKLVLSGIPVFVLGLQNIDEDDTMNIEHCKRLTSVMQLLRALIESESTREQTLVDLEDIKVHKVFSPLIGNSTPRQRAGDANNCTPEAVSLYINTLVLISELSNHSPRLVTTISELLQHRQIHSILAEALYSGSEDIKYLILSMAVHAWFPKKQIAAAMCEHLPMRAETNSMTSIQNNLMCYPTMSIAQNASLDDTIQMLKDACAKNQIINISTSDVMELYEYKLSAMGHAERAAMASVEAASQRCTHLQHQTAQLTAEISRIRQLFIHTQQRNEELNKSQKAYTDSIQQLENRLGAEKGKRKVIQSQLTKQLQEKETQLEEFVKRTKEFQKEKETLKEDNMKLRKLSQKLEDNLKKLEKVVEKRNEALKINSATITNLKMQIDQLEKQVTQCEIDLKNRNEELTTVSAELAEKSSILQVITSTLQKK